MSGLVQVLAIAAGVVMLLRVLASAVRTVVIPRPERVLLTRLTFEVARRSTQLVSARIKNPARREQWLAMFGPAALLLLPVLTFYTYVLTADGATVRRRPPVNFVSRICFRCVSYHP